MAEGDKPLTPPGNIKRPLIPVVSGWVKTIWEHIPLEMVPESYLKCGVSKKIDALHEDFLGEGVAETGNVARIFPILKDFNHIIRQKIR